MNLLRRIKRLWRGRGFGVHSPFAYWFVTDVLNLSHGYEYYGYETIREIVPPRSRRLYRLILRVGASLGARSVAVEKGLDGTLPFRIIEGTDAPADLVVLSPGATEAFRAYGLERLAAGATLIFSDRAYLREVKRQMGEGMSFTNNHGLTVAVGRRGLPLTHYNVSF